jgi:hypothetical protein
MWNITSFYTSILRNFGECKMELDSNELFNSCANVD